MQGALLPLHLGAVLNWTCGQPYLYFVSEQHNNCKICL